MSWVKRGWPLQATVVLSPYEEQLDRETVQRMERITTDETIKEHLEDSLRHRGLRYCDECGAWFQSSCLCDDFRKEDI